MIPLFKYPQNQREFSRLDYRLKRIINVMMPMALWVFMDELVITSIYRNDGSTHSQRPPYRFVDVAILETGGLEGSEKMRSAINILFPYGKEGFETIPPLRHGNAPHFHIQCKPA